MKKIGILFGIILYFTIKFHMVTVMADFSYNSEDTLELYGKSALLLDAKTGEVLYEKNGEEFCAIASTTKILTCLIALEEGSSEDVITVSENAASQPDVQMNMEPGEQYRMNDLLHGMMLESYNDVSVAVAEHLAGSTDAFAEKMNERAKKIGCRNSYFITPNGLDAKASEHENGSTAYDLALILAEAIKNPEFLKITQTRTYTIREISGNRIVNAYNRNSFLDAYEGVLSGKTGFTGKAGYCYAGAVQKDDRIFVAVTLGSGWPPHKTYKWKDMQILFDYGFENFQYKQLQIEPEIKEIKIPVENAKGSTYKEKVFMEIELPIEGTVRLVKNSDRYYGKLIYPNTLTAPVKQNETIGKLEIYQNDTLVGIREIKSPYLVEKQNFWTNIYQILCYIFDKICRKSIEIT